jgi:moderate conductance mechanosensitive channel
MPISPTPAVPILQQAQPPSTNFVERLLLPNGSEAIATGVVYLDGYPLFSITAPVIQTENSDSGTPSPIKTRTKVIEKRLQGLAMGDLASLTVTQQVDAATQLPVLYVNGQELMTVTHQDALLYSSDPEQRAAQLTDIVREALQRTQQEREPAFLQQQAAWAVGISLLMLGGGLLITWRQRYLKSQQFPNLEREQFPDAQGGVSEAAAEATLTVEKGQKQLQQQRNVRRLKLLVLRIGKYALFAGGSFRILGLFPQTRWLQILILTGAKVPLQLLGIGLLTYLLMRISFVLIDRLCLVFRQQPFLPSIKSQRSTLRIATVAKVLHGVSVVILTGIGALGMLAVLGIDLVPLLAGVSVLKTPSTAFLSCLKISMGLGMSLWLAQSLALWSI